MRSSVLILIFTICVVHTSVFAFPSAEAEVDFAAPGGDLIPASLFKNFDFNAFLPSSILKKAIRVLKTAISIFTGQEDVPDDILESLSNKIKDVFSNLTDPKKLSESLDTLKEQISSLNIPLLQANGFDTLQSLAKQLQEAKGDEDEPEAESEAPEQSSEPTPEGTAPAEVPAEPPAPAAAA